MQTILKNSKPDISCIYVNYHSVQFLEHSLKTLSQWEQDISYEVIIVNNDVTEEKSIALLAQKFQAKVISAFLNPGFGAAANRGAARAEGELLFFVNPDTEWRESFFRPVLEKMRKNPKIGVLGIQMVSPDGVKETHGAGEFFSLTSFFSSKQSQVSFIDWVSGGSLFIAKDVFLRLKGFDERFFLYFEDMDLCLRVRKDGMMVLQESQHTLIHHGGKSHVSKKSQKKYYDQSLYRYTQKHWSGCSSRIFRFLHPLYRYLFPYGRN